MSALERFAEAVGFELGLGIARGIKRGLAERAFQGDFRSSAAPASAENIPTPPTEEKRAPEPEIIPENIPEAGLAPGEVVDVKPAPATGTEAAPPATGDGDRDEQAFIGMCLRFGGPHVR